ncbi:hypothetical protein MMC07_005779 [Pseudocyphellaria aurata]|nr:hypothetical protein [Pseudocyphellaria aurata]
MRPSSRFLAPGFFKRSLDEFKRLSKIAVNQEGLRTPTAPYHLIDFTDPATIEVCKTMADVDLGGYSSVALDFIPERGSDPAHARFHGSISIELPRDNPDVHRSGYAAWRNHDRKPTIFGRSLWNIDPYAYLALRVKSDGRKYLVNIQTESIVYTDIHQHRLFAQRPGEWETILIQWNEFVRTNYGTVVEPQSEILRQKVRTIGVGLTDRVPGPYDLAIHKIWACNGLDEADDAGESAPKDEFARKRWRPR